MRLADFMLSSHGRSFDLKTARPVDGMAKAIASAALFLHQPAQVHLVVVASIDVASVIIADTFQRAKVDGSRIERRHVAVLGALATDALLEAWLQSGLG